PAIAAKRRDYSELAVLQHPQPDRRADQVRRRPRIFRAVPFRLGARKPTERIPVPGGNVYVTDSMMRFVRNKEELAGVLCHETSHDIHHDVMNVYRKNQQLGLYATI